MSGQDLVPNEPHALHGMTIDLSDDVAAGDPAAAAAIDLTADSSSEEEEEEAPAAAAYQFKFCHTFPWRATLIATLSN